MLHGPARRRRTTSSRPRTRILRDAKGFGHNAFKIELAKRADRPRPEAGRRHGADAHDDRTTSAQPISRVDGRAKVTGAAKYAAEYHVPNLAYGFVVSSAIAKGGSRGSTRARRSTLAGVLQVFTHENAPRLAVVRPQLPRRDRAARLAVPPAVRRRDQVQRPAGRAGRRRDASSWRATRRRSSGSSTNARAARHRSGGEARIEPTSRRHETGIEPPPKPRGDADKAFASAAVQLEAEYRVPVEHHNPMEPFATTVVWEDDGTLTVYDKTQGVQNVQDYLCNVFGFSKDDVRVVSPFVGGAFGSGLRPQYQVFLAVLAARELKRSVRVALTRQQMFSLRPPPRRPGSDVALGAARRRHARSRHPRGGRRDLAVRGLQRRRRQLVGPALPVRQRQARSQGRAARPAHAVRHARAGGRLGRVRARMRDGRARRQARHRPARAAAEELRREGPERGQAVLEQGAARVLPARRGAVRLGAARPRAAVDARRRSRSSAGAWRPASGRRMQLPATREGRADRRRQARRSAARRRTSAPARTRS